MRIYDQSLTGATGETGRAAESQRLDRQTGVRSGSTAPGNSDRVELSNTLNSLSRALTSYGSDRAKRVQELAGQYQSGQYRPNSQATSRGMIAEALAGGAS